MSTGDDFQVFRACQINLLLVDGQAHLSTGGPHISSSLLHCSSVVLPTCCMAVTLLRIPACSMNFGKRA